MNSKALEYSRKPGKLLIGAAIAGALSTAVMIYAWIKYKDYTEK